MGGHSEFIGAAVVTGVIMVLVIYTAKAFYQPIQTNGWGVKSKPNMTIYGATSFPVSTYAGWLIFQFVLLVNAAFSKDGNSSFINQATSGPVALFLVVFSLAIIPVFHASLDVQNSFTIVNAYVFGALQGYAVYGLYERFMGRARRIYVCDDVCIGEPVQG